MKNRLKMLLRFSLMVLVVLTLIFPVFQGRSSLEGGILKFRIRNPIVVRLIHKITIFNKEGLTVRDVRLWVPIIRNQTPHHFVMVNKVTASLQYEKIETDPSGNIYFFWSIGSIFPKESFTAEIEYLILSFDVQYEIDAYNVGSYVKDSETYWKYTQPEKYIESNDPLIVQTAGDIAGNETNPQFLALKIADFVLKALTYEVQTKERGAKWALINGEGDCSEYSYLFTALCRASGIPARIQTGFAFHKENERTTAGHMWAEYYLENYGWVPVDLTWQYIDFQDNLHFSSLQTFPMKHPYDNYFVECSTPIGSFALETSQTVEIFKASIDEFESFSLAYLTYNSVLEVEKAENLYFISKLMGARIFAPTDLARLEEALQSFDLSIQQALEGNSTEKIQQAQSQIEYILGLAKQIIFKCGIIITLIILAITLILMRLSQKRKVREESILS